MRERLIELINKGSDKYPTLPTINGCKEVYNHFLADHLLANGVIALPIDVGNMVYANQKNWKTGEYEVVPYQITNITITKNKKGIWTKKYRAMWFIGGKTVDAQINFAFDDIGKTVFLSQEEAEAKLKEGKG